MTYKNKVCPSTAQLRATGWRGPFVGVCFTQFGRAALLLTFLGATQNVNAQVPKDMFNQPLMIDSLRGLVMATPFTVGSNNKGGYLRLPDGSVIRTVWPAALEVNLPDLGGEPVWPRCEPAVYSLARIMPDGKELWAKSYIYYNNIVVKIGRTFVKIEACDKDKYDFVIHSHLGEVTMPGYYETPYRNRVFQGVPGDSRGMFILNPESGNVDMTDPPKNLHVIDAYELRKLKLRIADEVQRDMASKLRANKKLNPYFIQKREEFKRLEKALFPKPPKTTP